jgi:3-hydroxyacyl-CoA dehydrogenase
LNGVTDSRLLVVINDNVRVQALERIAVLTINNPPVNALSGPVISGMLGGIAAAIDACEIDAIVLVCAGRTFIAGADVKSLDARQAKADFFELQRRMDNSSAIRMTRRSPVIILRGSIRTAAVFPIQ